MLSPLNFSKTRLLLSALIALPVCASAADWPRTLDDCQSVTDRTARFACYDAVESNKPKAVIPAGATQSTIPARTATPAAAPPVAAATTSNSGSNDITNYGLKPQTGQATVQAEPTKKPFYKRWLPFGWGDDKEETKAPAPTATPQAAQRSGNEVDNYGLKQDVAKVQTSTDGIKELSDVVASTKKIGYNTIEVTLASGQVWRQMEDKRYPLEAGDKIRIAPTGWGTAYRMYSDRLGSFIQVERTK